MRLLLRRYSTAIATAAGLSASAITLGVGLWWGASEQVPPMAFREVQQCADTACSDVRGRVIVGFGEITSATPDAFDAFTRKTKTRRLVLLSGGGSAGAGQELGERIRAAGMTTIAPKTLPMRFEDGRTTTIEPYCASACVDAFLGGKRRLIEDGAQIGIHQFYSPPGTKPDQGRTQYWAIESARYVVRMVGADALGMLSKASTVRPEDMHWLTSAEMRAWAISTGELN